MKFEDRKSGGLTSISYRFSVGAALSTAAYWSNVCFFLKKSYHFSKNSSNHQNFERKSSKFYSSKFKVLRSKFAVSIPPYLQMMTSRSMHPHRAFQDDLKHKETLTIVKDRVLSNFCRKYGHHFKFDTVETGWIVGLKDNLLDIYSWSRNNA